MRTEMVFLRRIRRKINIQCPHDGHGIQIHDRDRAAEDIGRESGLPICRRADRQRRFLHRNLSQKRMRARLIQGQAPCLRHRRRSIEAVLAHHDRVEGRRANGLRTETRREGSDDLVRGRVDDLDTRVGGRGPHCCAGDGEVGEFPVGGDPGLFAAWDGDFPHKGFGAEVDDRDEWLGFVACVCLAAVGRHDEPVRFGFALDLFRDRAGCRVDAD